MSEKLDLLGKIEKKLPEFSKGQKRIANFIINHYEKAVYLTASKLGEVSGVSESTVVRFAIELDFDGYTKFQHALEELVKTKLTASQRMEVSQDRIFKNDKHILRAILQSDAERILSTANEVNLEAFDNAIDAILNARRVYIIGGRSSSSLVSFFSFYLNLACENVVHVDSSAATEVFEQIFRISEKDVCIGLSFPRYSQRTLTAIEYANEQNAKVIAITDSYDSPIAAYAQYKLIAKTDMMSFVDSLTAPLSLINAILVAIAQKKKGDLIKTFDKLEAIWQEYQVYAFSNEQIKYEMTEQQNNEEKKIEDVKGNEIKEIENKD